jgi:glutamine synthetase
MSRVVTAAKRVVYRSEMRPAGGVRAPALIDWGLDNRSAMVRIPPERGAAAREFRERAYHL